MVSVDSKDLWYTDDKRPDDEEIVSKLSRPNAERLVYSLRNVARMSIDEIYEITKIDRWFLDSIIRNRRDGEPSPFARSLGAVNVATLREAKQMGFSDRQLATMLGSDDIEVRQWRKSLGVVATFKSVDTCAAEFEGLYALLLQHL